MHTDSHDEAFPWPEVPFEYRVVGMKVTSAGKIYDPFGDEAQYKLQASDMVKSMNDLRIRTNESEVKRLASMAITHVQQAVWAAEAAMKWEGQSNTKMAKSTIDQAVAQVNKTPQYSDLEVSQIAVVCHEANRAWCYVNGDNSQRPWAEAEDWQKESAIMGVRFRLQNPDAHESAQHDAWSAAKKADGWIYGETKDADAKTHPCLVPFEQLPVLQQKKDKLFQAIVDALK